MLSRPPIERARRIGLTATTTATEWPPEATARAVKASAEKIATGHVRPPRDVQNSFMN